MILKVLLGHSVFSLAGKVLSLYIIYLGVKYFPEVKAGYFSASLLGAGLASSLLLCVPFAIQTERMCRPRTRSVLEYLILLFSAGYILYWYFGFSVVVLWASMVNVVVTYIVVYLYRFTGVGPRFQLFFIVLTQPILYLGAILLEPLNVVFEAMEMLGVVSLVILVFGFISLWRRSDFILRLKSLEAMLVGSTSIFIIYSGIGVEAFKDILVFWIVVQIGNATVFLGSTLSYLLMEKHRTHGAYDATVGPYYIVAASIFGLLMLSLIFEYFSVFCYGLTLCFQGFVRGYSTVLLSGDKAEAIFYANIFSCLIIAPIAFLIPSFSLVLSAQLLMLLAFLSSVLVPVFERFHGD